MNVSGNTCTILICDQFNAVETMSSFVMLICVT